MIRTAAPRSPRSTAVRSGAALAGVAGILLLAGCGASTPETGGSGSGTDTADGAGAGGSYADGTYTADGSYQTPESIETIEVTVTLAGGVIEDVEVVGNPTKPESEEYQGRFIGGIADEVVGRSIDEIQVSRVAGSSLTSGGFNEAIEQIKTDAAA
jgi:uncharacterized protein with FMN-binding domain